MKIQKNKSDRTSFCNATFYTYTAEVKSIFFFNLRVYPFLIFIKSTHTHTQREKSIGTIFEVHLYMSDKHPIYNNGHTGFHTLTTKQ